MKDSKLISEQKYLTLTKKDEISACGVGFIVSRQGIASNKIVNSALEALSCVEHRGACSADGISGDGTGIMTDIPFEMFGYNPGSIAIATLFLPTDKQKFIESRNIFEEVFNFMGLEIVQYRDIPINENVLGVFALNKLPNMVHAIIQRPNYCRTDESFNQLLYTAKQHTQSRITKVGLSKSFFFTSLSTTTIIYKGLTTASSLAEFYPDLQNKEFKSRFALFHRRFSTNTVSSWDKAQPFRLIAHNGEINTIEGNRSLAYARHRDLGLQRNALLTHTGVSDSGSLNEMVEALQYRSSIPYLDNSIAIMIPPAGNNSPYYQFWSRAMEPWDGPAFICYSDGEIVGARLDRNGFRPCRWSMTDKNFYLCSEAGAFAIAEDEIISKGSLGAGTGVRVVLSTGRISFKDPSESRENKHIKLSAGLYSLPENIDSQIDGIKISTEELKKKMLLFSYSKEDIQRFITPMVVKGKEDIGSMGDTARLAIFSEQKRSLFDYFYQDFAQVTNPPLDYLRESISTDLVTYVGKRPNIFEPKELIPPPHAIKLDSPVLSLGASRFFQNKVDSFNRDYDPIYAMLNTTFNLSHGQVGFKEKLYSLKKEAVSLVKNGAKVIILSDESASPENPPIPSLLALRGVVLSLFRSGLLLDTAIIVHSGEIRSTHQLAALISFGATAVCPYIPLLCSSDSAIIKGSDSQKNSESEVLKAFENGLLKIMSKMGISSIRSYQFSQLFTTIGLGAELINEFFPDLSSPIGGIELSDISSSIIERASELVSSAETKFAKTYIHKEHARDKEGERHAMTNSRSRIVHSLVKVDSSSKEHEEIYNDYLSYSRISSPVSIRHLFSFNKAKASIAIDNAQSIEDILKTFGSGAMSFGSISAESQRDIFLAMQQIGGRSNSGEGGENPYFYSDGITSTTKQVASARFGVTAKYLATAKEFQIKVAQGAKPGEGGQLMALKVSEEIAFARHSNPNIDLISPPPLHDIYSIEDLKQLIYELKQFNSEAKISVKLVSGANIGTIAMGVVKAGADIIHISGFDGGTGAATLTSMRHAGLPWELGLSDVHKTLTASNLRDRVTLRVDGGMHTGADIIFASILGADEFDFGKLLLVAQGCIMARICEKNTCPTGIATHDPKFKAKYKGSPEAIVAMLTSIAKHVRSMLQNIGVKDLLSLKGRTDILTIADQHKDLITARNIDLSNLMISVEPPATGSSYQDSEKATNCSSSMSLDKTLNSQIVDDSLNLLEKGYEYTGEYSISTKDRAVFSELSGKIAKGLLSGSFSKEFSGNFSMTGSAGQGFGVFLIDGLNVKLFGEANDSVGKGMSGGEITIQPSKDSKLVSYDNTIIGNSALYGATGGKVYISGIAGDRFAVRNSGASAVVEGVGLHACEYMTSGTVVILGATSRNIGAGMTGGRLFIRNFSPDDKALKINSCYIEQGAISSEDVEYLKAEITAHFNKTESVLAEDILSDWDNELASFSKFIPIKK